MLLVPAKCPECDGNMDIDPKKWAAICEYCGELIFTEDAIGYFNTAYNITNNIRTDAENYYEDSSNKDFVIETGVLKEYTGEDTAVQIPNNVLAISGAFIGNKYLRGVIIPDSVTSIGGDAFSGCSSLTQISLPDSVTEIRWAAFSGCTSLTQISLPDNVTSIGRDAFHDTPLSWRYFQKCQHCGEDFEDLPF